MNQEIKRVLKKLVEVKKILETFSSSSEAIHHLMQETNLSETKCRNAYDFFSNLKISDPEIIFNKSVLLSHLEEIHTTELGKIALREI